MGFQAIGRLDDIEIGSAIKVTVGGLPVAVVHLDDGEVRAVHNICSHQQCELAPDGWVEDNRIECVLHGSMFDLSTGEPDSLPAILAIPVYACKVEAGQVMVDVEQQLNVAPKPDHAG